MAEKTFPEVTMILALALSLLVGTGEVCVAAKRTAGGTAAGIVEGTIDPAAWGKAYPDQYHGWKATAEPTPAGKSKYKRGFDTDGIIYDKIDEYPYLALLLKGWGYGVEFREPRGHVYMIQDQLEVEPARLKAGGSCLSCKTPYAPALYGEMKGDYFSKPYQEVLGKIPEKDRLLGVACVDCHQSDDLSLKLSRGFTLGKALQGLGKDHATLTTQDKRFLVCAQCHVTYSIPKDEQMKSRDVVFPWQGGTWGDISIEHIIANIRSTPAFGEWTQSVTGFKLGFVRHPEFELFSRNSPHWQQEVSCADCHMPATDNKEVTVSDHRIMSPLKNDLKACAQCHDEDAETLRGKVFAIQDEVASLLIRDGYATARVAKLFELTHKAKATGKTVDGALYDQAKDAYQEAFYRVMYIQNENSTGFHNPPETLRILWDAQRYASQAESFLRQVLAAAKVEVAETVDLELEKYLNDRGEKKLPFAPEMEIRDPKGGRTQGS